MNPKICIIGDVVTDVSLPQGENGIKVRLGGVTHCSRMAWAIGTSYDLYFVSPTYLSESVRDYHAQHGAGNIVQIGKVDGAPYVFLIGSVKETGDQLYEFLLRDQINIEYVIPEISFSQYDDILITTGNFTHEMIMDSIEGSRVHIDLSNNTTSVEEIGNFLFETIFISTSSQLFKDEFTGNFLEFAMLFEGRCNRLILKENRGGSRIFEFTTNEILNIPSITQPIVHSVGVGDAYNVAFISKYKSIGVKEAGFLSSWLASEYASTTYVDDFKTSVENVLKIKLENLIGLGGCSLPWEKRKEHSIYIAAPDFDYMDKTQIELLVDSLEYHNFYPRRPILENGQLNVEDSEEVRARTYEMDIELLHKAKLLIAVYISDDPGTMIEIGYAKALGISCLVYDPYKKAENCILTHMPDLVTSDLDELMSEVFIKMSKLYE